MWPTLIELCAAYQTLDSLMIRKEGEPITFAVVYILFGTIVHLKPGTSLICSHNEETGNVSILGGYASVNSTVTASKSEMAQNFASDSFCTKKQS